MPITFTYRQMGADGKTYPVDKDGNRIVEELILTEEEQYYVDTTPEDWARERTEREARRAEYGQMLLDRAKPFLFKPLDRPKAALSRHPLWGDYWAEREFCIMAGDTGVGKSLLAIQIGKHLAGGVVFGNNENVGRPRKVLYIDFELDSEAFWMRYGNDDGIENFYWAGFNQHADMPDEIDRRIRWLLNNLEDAITNTKAEVLIIDQVDRLQIPIGKRMEFLYKLKELTRKYKLSTLLTLNTRHRNFSKGVELHHIQNSKLYVPFADSVVAIAADYNYETDRYIKPLKMRNRTLHHAGEVQCFNIYPSENENGNTSLPPSGYSLNEGDFSIDKKLLLSLTAMRPEEVLLKKGRAKLKQEQMLKAEALRRDGMTYEYIADDMLLPVSTVKRWVSCIKPKLRPDGSNPLHLLKGSPTPNPSPKERSFNTIEFVVTEKPDCLTDEEWAACVNNPESENYDAFAFNPYLPEWGEE